MVSAATSAAVHARQAASSAAPTSGPGEALGLPADREVGEHPADVHQQQGSGDQQERRHGQRRQPHQDVRRPPSGAREVERDGAEAEVARDQRRRLRGDEHRDQQLGGERVGGVGDDLLVEAEEVLGLHEDAHQDQRRQQHQRQQGHRQHLRAPGPAEAEAVAQAGDEEGPRDRPLPEPRAGVGAVADVVDDGAGHRGARGLRRAGHCRHPRPGRRPRCGGGAPASGPGRGRGRR